MSVHSAPPNQQDPEIFEDVHFGQQFLSNLKRGNVNIFQMGKMALELVLILIPATTHQKILNILRHQGFGLDWVLFILYTSALPVDWWKPTRRRPYGNRAFLLDVIIGLRMTVTLGSLTHYLAMIM